MTAEDTSFFKELSDICHEIGLRSTVTHDSVRGFNIAIDSLYATLVKCEHPSLEEAAASCAISLLNRAFVPRHINLRILQLILRPSRKKQYTVQKLLEENEKLWNGLHRVLEKIDDLQAERIANPIQFNIDPAVSCLDPHYRNVIRAIELELRVLLFNLDTKGEQQ